jgi:isopropylmalate/homocitrate/citramalate synthase
VAAVRGASWIQGTIDGIGERAGNANIGEIALALRCLYEVPVALDLTKVREVSDVVSKASGYTLDAWKPLVGENLFMRESGAVAGQFHIPEAIEPYSSELVNARRRIVLGKKSGLDIIDLKARELGLAVATEQRATILGAVKKRAIAKRGLLTDDEFSEIVRRVSSPDLGKQGLRRYASIS